MTINKENVHAGIQSKVRDDIIILSICECHIHRIGWLRTLFGGFSMYLTIPVWILLHFTTATFLYQKVFCKLFGLKPVEWKNHVLIERYKIDGLRLMDRLNCIFCAYANGLTTMINKEIDNLAAFRGELGLIRYMLAGLATLFFIPVLLISELFALQIVYNILIAPVLGMHRKSFFEVEKILKEQGYAQQYPPFSQSVLLFAKNTFYRFACLLEQIESSWCPLKHIKTHDDFVAPPHHDKFLNENELPKMRQILVSEGTVSDKKPLY